MCKVVRRLPIIFTLTFASLICASLAFAQGELPDVATTYTYTAVNAPGASSTAAYAINNSGKIVGVITGGDCAQTSDQSSCGFLDVKGTFTTVACELENATDFFDISNTNEGCGSLLVFWRRPRTHLAGKRVLF